MRDSGASLRLHPLHAPFRLVAGTAALGAVLGLAARGAEPFRSWTYQLAWVPLLVAADAALALGGGVGPGGAPRLGGAGAPLTGRPRFALSLFAWSVPAWLLFEVANFRLANWYYVNVPPHRALRWLGAAAAFATVLPAIYLAHAWLGRIGVASGCRGPRFEAGPLHRAALLAIGALFAALAVWKPRLFYPLVWGAVTLLLEPFNHSRAPARSLLADVAAGRYARPVRLAAAGLLVGLAWELLNSFAGTRWIYTVPGLEGAKVFEMPLPGFLGFPIFALDCFVLYQTLTLLGVAAPGWDGGRVGSGPPTVPPGASTSGKAAAVAGGVVLSLLALVGIDRYTVDSLRPSLVEIPGVGRAEASRLRAASVRGVEALARLRPIDVAMLTGLAPAEAEGAVRFARLAALRGIGTVNAYALLAAGVGTVCDLASEDPVEISSAVRMARSDPHAGLPRRVRVWARAARAACDTSTTSRTGPRGGTDPPTPPALLAPGERRILPGAPGHGGRRG